MGSFYKKAGCPKCGSRDNVAIYNDDGKFNGKCNGCGELYWDINPDSDLGQQAQVVAASPQPQHNVGYTQESIDQIQGYPHPSYRGIPAEVTQLYGIRGAYNQYTGDLESVYYPYISNNKITAYKKKVLATKDITIIGNFKNVELFGECIFNPPGKVVLITEGEDDAPSAYTMIKTATGQSITCVSVQSGATVNEDTGIGVVDRCIKRRYPYLAQAEIVVLCMDQDHPGRAVMLELAEDLSRNSVVKIMTFAFKDANEMLQGQRLKDFVDAYNNATTYRPSDVVTWEDVTVEDLMKPIPKGLTIPYPKLHKAMHGLRYGPDGGGELTLVCAGPGVGKTTFCREIGYHIYTAENLPVGTIYLEEQFTKTMQGYIALDNNVSLAQLRETPEVITPDQWRASKQKFEAVGGAFHRHFGSLASNKVINVCHWMYTTMHTPVIILDHISLVVSGMKSGRDGERKDIDILMTQLATFVTCTGCHVVAVVHLKRASGKKITKDNEGNIDRENAPFNRGGVISIDDLRGSAALEQLPHNIIAVEGDIMDEQDPNLRWLRLLKCREWSNLGIKDYVRFNPKTGRFLPMSM